KQTLLTSTPRRVNFPVEILTCRNRRASRVTRLLLVYLELKRYSLLLRMPSPPHINPCPRGILPLSVSDMTHAIVKHRFRAGIKRARDAK
ncbi:uncharacterized, partial [Tachysurus ichikawai]